MYTAISDEQIVALIPACQRGDSGATERLYDLYADRIYRYALARIGDTQAAEDLTAEVFLRVIRHVRHFRLDTRRPASSVSAWLYRIAANLIADYHRARRRRPSISLDEEAPLALDAPGPQQVAERHEALERLSGAMARLTEEQRLVVICKFSEGMSNAQVAAMLGKTEGAIEGLQHRALRSLCRLLDVKRGEQ